MQEKIEEINIKKLTLSTCQGILSEHSLRSSTEKFVNN